RFGDVGNNMLDALGANNCESMALAVHYGLNIFFFHFDHALGSDRGCAMVAGDTYKLAAFQSAVKLVSYCLIGGTAKIAAVGIAPYGSNIGHGVALHYIVTSKGDGFLSTYLDLAAVQANRTAFPRLGYKALCLIVMPYVHFEGAGSH